MFLRYDIVAHPYGTAAMLHFDVVVALYYGKSVILVGRYKPGEQLHYLFFPCYPVGSPSCCLFLRYDMVVHPCGTAAVLRFDAAVAPYCGKALFWAHAESHGNNYITYSFHAILLDRLAWRLFLRHDIDAHPYATATVPRLNAASPPYCGKALFWAHTASRTNK